ncbi:hypothetical protein D3C75_1024170 [compost metagenome]
MACSEGCGAVTGDYGIHNGLMVLQFDHFITGDRPEIALIHRAEQVGERGEKRIGAGFIDQLVVLGIDFNPAFAVKIHV